MTKSNFYFNMSIIFWLIMMVGFSDNWLYDTDQPSNYNPIFIVHGLLAFSWYSLLVIQSGLIKNYNLKIHKNLGVYGFAIFLLLIPSSLAIYIEMLLTDGTIDPNGLGLLFLYLFAIILIFMAYGQREKSPAKHKMLMSFGSFLMLRPAVDRVFNKVLDNLPFLVIISLYLLTFIGFYYIYYRHKGKLQWYMVIGFAIWFAGVFFGYLI